MRFGFLNTLEDPQCESYSGLLDDLREQAQICDQGGFDHIWFGEHHFGAYGRDTSPNPFMIASDIGSRTTRIRLGIAVVILPLWHPLRVAENITLLDHLYKGRVEIGFGRASQPHEVTAFNLAADPRNPEGSREVFAELLEIVKLACTEEFFSYSGKHYQVPPTDEIPYTPRRHVEEDPRWLSDGKLTKLSVVPRPFQKPHPPFWMAVSTEGSAEIAAQLDLKPMCWRQPARTLRVWVDRYAETRAANGKPTQNPGDDWALLRNIHVAPTNEQARKEYEPYLTHMMQFRAADPWRAMQAFLDPGEKVAPGTDLDWDFLQNRCLIAGSPEFVTEKILEQQEITGAGTIIANPAIEGFPHAKTMQCLDLLNERVIPAVQKTTIAEAV